jgi:hypothetical protein
MVVRLGLIANEWRSIVTKDSLLDDGLVKFLLSR